MLLQPPYTPFSYLPRTKTFLTELSWNPRLLSRSACRNAHRKSDLLLPFPLPLCKNLLRTLPEAFRFLSVLMEATILSQSSSRSRGVGNGFVLNPFFFKSTLSSLTIIIHTLEPPLTGRRDGPPLADCGLVIRRELEGASRSQPSSLLSFFPLTIISRPRLNSSLLHPYQQPMARRVHLLSFHSRTSRPPPPYFLYGPLPPFLDNGLVFLFTPKSRFFFFRVSSLVLF